MKEKDVIGFVGLGAMGRPMAAHLARAGFELVVHDLRPEAVAALEAEGARAGGSVAAVAREADVVFTMLPDSPDVEAVVLGPDGLAAHARPEALIVDMSTIDPAATDRLAASLAERGLGFADAPVGRTQHFAEQGKCLFMVGAGDNDLGRLRPCLAAMGDTILHCGRPGAGIRTKLVNNFIAVATCQVNAEALTLAARLGLDTGRTLEVINGTTATNGQLALNWPKKSLAGDVSPGFRIALALKDLRLALDAARAAGVPMFAGSAVGEAVAQAARTGDFADKDFSALLDVVAGQAGVTPPRLG